MSYLRVLPNKKVQATVRLCGVNKYKTFLKKSDAQAWANDLDSKIKKISLLSRNQLASLCVEEISDLGGAQLFQQLGIDLFSIQNNTRLAIINKLTKKELLQLTPQQIDKMGGPELFIKAGKRIRFKTFNKICSEYFKHWTGKDYKNQISRASYWCTVFGDRIITDIDIFDVREHIDVMQQNNNRLATITRKKAVLSSVFKFALNRGYIDDNPAKTVVIANDSKPRSRVLTADERPRLTAACKLSDWPKMYLLVSCAMYSGARKSELLGLRWNDINFIQRSASLGDTKNGSSRTIYFPGIVIDQLKKIQEVGNGLIFPSKKDSSKPLDIRNPWAKALADAKISGVDVIDDDGSIKLEKFTFHCLLHGYCSALSDSGKELSEIAEMAGHKSLQTTMRYIHQSHDRKQQIADDLEKAFN